jgi:2-aminoadipate transaminase
MRPTASLDRPLLPTLARRSDRLVSSAIRDLLHLAERPDVLSLAGGLPDGDTFATERIAEATQRALAIDGRYGATALQYGPSEGLAAMREWVAGGSLVHPALGTPDETLVTTGSQQALDLLARVVVDDGDVVVVEDPLYLGTRQVLLANGARLVGVPVDADGLDTDALHDLLRRGVRPRAVYTVPHFQNPTSATLSHERRVLLCALAQQFGFLVVEDDPYVALAFDGTRHEPLGSIAPEHVVTLGSASKVLAPGLRVGWLRAPKWLHRALVLAKQSSDLHTPSLNQLIALDVLSDDDFMGPQLVRLRATYRDKATALHHALGGAFAMDVPRGGMFLWGRAECDTTAALPTAIAAGVAYVPGAAFAVESDRSSHLRLSYASLTPDDLRVAAERLRAAIA